MKFHEQLICLKWSTMPYKHGMYFHWNVLDSWPPPTHSLGLFPKKKRVIFLDTLPYRLFNYRLWLGKYSTTKTVEGGGPPPSLTASICENFKTFNPLNMIHWYPKQILLHCEEAEKCIFNVVLMLFSLSPLFSSFLWLP